MQEEEAKVYKFDLEAVAGVLRWCDLSRPHISKEEMEKRLLQLNNIETTPKRGYKNLYQKSVLPATKGCDFDFLISEIKD